MQQISSKQKKRFRKLFQILRIEKSSKNDLLIAEVHNQVFAKTNCLACAQCCKTHSPLFLETDIERIAQYLKMRPADFVSKYLILDEDGDWIFTTVPCPFLEADNTCKIYDYRPKACAEYPHTNRKKIYQIEKITMVNAEICPAVSEILDIVSGLKNSI